MRTFARITAALLLLSIPPFAPNLRAQEITPGKDNAKRPIVFPRIQIKYSCFANYMDLWTDRPLLMDRSLRYKTGDFLHITPESFSREIKIARAYEVDGFSAFINGLALYKGAASTLAKENLPDFLLVPQFGVNNLEASSLSLIENGLQPALASPNLWRLNGEPVITSYVMDSVPVELWAPALKDIRAKSPERLCIVADMGVAVGALTQQLRSNPSNAVALEAFRKKLRAYLDICDGIMIGTGDFGERKPFGYGTSLNEETYTKVAATIKEVLAEPAYQGKLLGLGAPRGYINPLSGVVHREDGTRRLRRSFEIAMAARPDFIQLAEWNEVNENTCIAPTVAGSFTNQRIIRHYMRQLKGDAPAPNPGDDLSIPNLILSYRRAIKLGEAIDFEILNIPDAATTETYTAQLSLKDKDGKVLKTFPKETFIRNKMRALTVSFPSEEAPDSSAFIPSLKVINADGKSIIFEEGLLYIQSRPTWVTDYLEVHQPLRDLLKPQHASLTIAAEQPAAGAGIALEGEVTAGEDLASVEVIEGGKEVYGYDRENEFDLTNNIVIRGEFISARPLTLNGKLFVKNSEKFGFRPWEYANSGFTSFEIEPDGVAFNQKCNSLLRGFFITVPKADIEDAVIEFQGPSLSYSVPVKEIIKDQLYSRTFDDGLVFSLRHQTGLADIPSPINAKSAKFSCTVVPKEAEPVYHLRAITKSGKIYRSRPIMPIPSQGKGNRITLDLFSESKGGITPVAMTSDKVPDLDYVFDPARHELMVPSAGVAWAAELGGGIVYGSPFHAAGRFPAEAINSTPAWVKEDGVQSLKFDGVGTYIVFPTEALPRGPFTLSFDIKPTSNANEVLIRHHGSLIGSLTVRRSGGKLCASFTDSRVETTSFRSNLDLPTDRWSKVEIRYDLHQIVLQVDDKSESFPLSRQALYSAPTTFGGYPTAGFGVQKDDRFFKGYLKSFRIIHYAAALKNEPIP